MAAPRLSAAAVVLLLLAVSVQAALLRANNQRNPPVEAQHNNLTAEAEQLHKNLTDYLKNHEKVGQSDDHAFGQSFMVSSQKLLAELTEGSKSREKVKLTEQLVADLKLWAHRTSDTMAEAQHRMSENDANFLMKLLVERQKLPMGTQLAVLKRKDVKDLPWAQRLLKEHQDTGPCLADQFREILAKEAKDVKVKVGHRIAVDHSKMGDKERQLRKEVGKMQGEVTAEVGHMETEVLADTKLSKDPKAKELLKDAKTLLKSMETDKLTKKLKDLKEVTHDLKGLENLELAEKETAAKK